MMTWMWLLTLVQMMKLTTQLQKYSLISWFCCHWCHHPSLVELFHFRKLLLEMLQQVLVALPGEASQQCSRNVFTHCAPLETVLANLFCYTQNYTTKIVLTCQTDSTLQNLLIKHFFVEMQKVLVCFREPGEEKVSMNPWCLSKYDKFKAST